MTMVNVRRSQSNMANRALSVLIYKHLCSDLFGDPVFCHELACRVNTPTAFRCAHTFLGVLFQLGRILKPPLPLVLGSFFFGVGHNPWSENSPHPVRECGEVVLTASGARQRRTPQTVRHRMHAKHRRTRTCTCRRRTPWFAAGWSHQPGAPWERTQSPRPW